MIKIILIALLLRLFPSGPTTYYISSSTGSDSNPGTITQPYKHLSKVQGILNPGDSVLLLGGDVFNETLYASNSGTSGQRIVYATYGSGPAIVTGLSSVTGWVSRGGGVYQAPCPNNNKNLNTVLLNSAMQAMGRWPDTGYRTFTAITSNTITDAGLSGSPFNWTGATIAAKPEFYEFDTAHITAQSPTQITIATTFSSTDLRGNGYFIENDPRTLLVGVPTVGRWYNNTVTDSLYMYFGGVNPALQTVQVSIRDTGVYFSAVSHIVVNGIHFTGYNQYPVFMNNTNDINIFNCFLQYGGVNAVLGNQCPDYNFTRDTIDNFLNNGGRITGGLSNHDTLHSCVITNIGLLPGMGTGTAVGNGTFAYTGWVTPGNATLIDSNIFNHIGYNAICPSGDSTKVNNNYINDFCKVKIDGGGIYWIDLSFISWVQVRQCNGNVITNGGGNPGGVNYDPTDASFCIYNDSHVQYINESNNTLAFAASAGMIDHGSHITFTSNNLYGNGYTQSLVSELTSIPITNLIYKKNVHAGSNNLQLFNFFESVSNDLSSFGTVDSNYYLGATWTPAMFRTLQTGDPGTYRIFSDWQNNTGYDANGVYFVDPLPAYFSYNSGKTSASVTLINRYIDVTGGGHGGSFSQAGLSSVIWLAYPKWSIQPSEYTIPVADSLSRPLMVSGNLGLTGNNGSGTSGIPLVITFATTTIVSVNNTLHAGSFVGFNGKVYVTGNNTDGEMGLSGGASSGTLVNVPLDSRGVPLTNIKMVQGSYIQIGANDIAGQYFVKSGTLSDTIFYAGVNQYGMGGDGNLGPTTYQTPQLMYSLPSGKRIVQMCSESVTAMLLNDGTVWTWGAAGTTSYLGRTVTGSNYATPIQVTGFDDSIRQIAGGAVCGIIALSKRDSLWGWGPSAGYLGNAGNPSYTTPHNLGDSIKRYIENGTTRTKILQIACNSNSWHIIANDSSLWGWGDAAMGTIGDGSQSNLASPGGTSTPWFIDPSAVLVLAKTHPVQVTAKTNFQYIPSGCLFAFGTFAVDDQGQLYGCGRNKGSVIPNGVIECTGDGGDLSSNYPNSWDVPLLTPLNPYGVTSTIQQTCLGCHTGAVTAFCHSCGTTSGATANAGPNQNIAVSTTSLTGAASTSTGGKIVYYTWTRLSGSGTIDVPAAISPNVFGLTAGPSVFQLSVQDQGFNVSTSTVTINFNPSCGCIPVPVGAITTVH